jgi:ectoine hydroxylase-related dioxygenase (phytanoyl-CoA dioxygenase family)
MMTSRTLGFPLVSNGFTLDPTRLGWLEPSDPNESIERLRERLSRQGYLWLKAFFDRNTVLNVRRRYFANLEESGILQPGTEPVDGLYSGSANIDKQMVRDRNFEFVRWAFYESFCYSEPLYSFYERFFDGPVYLHRRKIVRHTTRDDTGSTGAHYDLTYLRGGTDRVLTSWIPLGDIPVEMGGLVYLEGSHTYGVTTEAEFRVKNAQLSPEERISAYNRNMTQGGWLTKDLPSLSERLNTRWLMADYEAGDMVVHTAYMIHAATNNLRENMRLSTDIRYQHVRDSIDERWTNHVDANDGL